MNRHWVILKKRLLLLVLLLLLLFEKDTAKIVRKHVACSIVKIAVNKNQIITSTVNFMSSLK